MWEMRFSLLLFELYCCFLGRYLYEKNLVYYLLCQSGGHSTKDICIFFIGVLSHPFLWPLNMCSIFIIFLCQFNPWLFCASKNSLDVLLSSERENLFRFIFLKLISVNCMVEISFLRLVITRIIASILKLHFPRKFCFLIQKLIYKIVKANLFFIWVCQNYIKKDFQSLKATTWLW